MRTTKERRAEWARLATHVPRAERFGPDSWMVAERQDKERAAQYWIAVPALLADLAAAESERDEAHAFVTEVREALGDDYAGSEAHWRGRSIASVCRLRTERDAAREALRAIEWCIRAVDDGPSCPRCAHAMYAGHASTCIIGAALAGKGGGTDEHAA